MSGRGTVALARPGRAASCRGTLALLAVLWLTLVRCESWGCDNGKLYLEMDLTPDAVSWDCRESPQRLPSIDSVDDPEQPAREICMDKPIYYNHRLPSSGPYRPVMAESGEYLYCPPQRWLNNLHHGAIVVLYHPCAPHHERSLLSGLARSCLPDFIMTPHKHLSKFTPIALVSWGRTLELPTVSSSAVCDWLAATHTKRTAHDGVTQNMKYNLLLTWSASLHPATKRKESLRECCEETISSLLSNFKRERLNKIEEGRRRRLIRAAAREKLDSVENNSEGFNTTNSSSVLINNSTETSDQRTVHTQNVGGAPGHVPDQQTLKRTPQPGIQNKSQGIITRPAPPFLSTISATPLKTGSTGFGTFHFDGSKSLLQTAAVQSSLELKDLRRPQSSAGTHALPKSLTHDQNQTTSPKTAAVSSQHEGTTLIRHRDKERSRKDSAELNNSNENVFDEGHTSGPTTEDNQEVDVKEREAKYRSIHTPPHSHEEGQNADGDSQPQLHPQSEGHSQAGSGDCDGCRAGEPCNCKPASGVTGLQRTPRTDEAVWAAAALGFLLILLTLSVLHTRLYRHWRTTPSLYWRDPRQDYDSVADVIRRRLRIAKRRRKRCRRQECVLLPSSSSSDEHA